ncbi:MAG TPA: glycogen/starch synthase, partial [Dehalococcoidia bacterium]|nr:glycogen/starch synthase [Dehalococcoidia bacterium]
MRILFIASEAFPLAKVGGLADVTSSLAIALQDSGHEPCLVLPKYGSIKAPIQEIQGKGFAVSLMGHSEPATLKKTMLKGRIPVYLVENQRYFGTEEIYTQDELDRFLFFALSIPNIISQLGFRPDIIHCHDWHASLVPLGLKKAKIALPCIFTIHNLAYQGSFDQEFFQRSGLSSVWQEYIPVGAPMPSLNFMSQGILLADIVTTVSPTYASEILTPQYAEGLEQLLSYRFNDLYGIVNGIDYDEYNPATDLYLERNYDFTTIERRVDNKLALQRKGGLPQNPDIPLFGMVSRLEEQKGIDLLLQAIDPFITETRAQLVILGEGREHYHKLLAEAALKYPDRLSAFIDYDERLAHLIYSGGDMFLMPSRFEPCGLGQLIAMRYGAIPVVRHTGGLVDTVKDVAEGNGNGFMFQNYTVLEMLDAIKRAEESFYHRAEWQNLMRRNMKLDFSWKASARKYEEIYLRARNIS